MSSTIPSAGSGNGRVARFTQLYGEDSPQVRDARRDALAANLNAAITRSLSAAAVPLKPEHAAALAARLKAAAR